MLDFASLASFSALDLASFGPPVVLRILSPSMPLSVGAAFGVFSRLYSEPPSFCGCRLHSVLVDRTSFTVHHASFAVDFAFCAVDLASFGAVDCVPPVPPSAL